MEWAITNTNQNMSHKQNEMKTNKAFFRRVQVSYFAHPLLMVWLKEKWEKSLLLYKIYKHVLNKCRSGYNHSGKLRNQQNMQSQFSVGMKITIPYLWKYKI